MERAHRDAERYHEDHYNPAFYVKERKRAVLLFLLFSDTFGVLVIKPFENKQKKRRNTTVASPILKSQYWESVSHVIIPILRILAPAIIHTTPAVISNTFLFTPYFMFPFCIILLIQGTKIVKICS